jgi:lysophospholipase L1-like esterase
VDIEAGSRLLFIGDSVTDTGRTQPVGEDRGGLGSGYVANVAALLGATVPDRRIRVMNTGTSGNTVRDLAARWQRDVVDLRPDWLSIMIGINDVWRQFDSPLQPEKHVLPDEYAKTLREIVTRVRPTLQGLVLMTPFYIEPNPADAMRARMDEYGGMVREVAKESGARFVDTQAAFNAVLARGVYPAILAGDRVHPNATGHMILARAFLNAVGFSWDAA